ncbi:MAG: GNAT family N-acetyltransferase [Candidatus Limnocylindrales bacterium]
MANPPRNLALRVAESDEDLEAWRRVRAEVIPNERVATIEWMRASMTPERVYLIAELDGEVVGSGLGGRSDFGHAGLHPRVVPSARRRGVGSAILRELADRAWRLGFTEAGTQVDDEGSLAFAQRYGYREVDRQIELVRTIGDETWPEVPVGLEIVTVADRPDLWRFAYEPLGIQAFEDMAHATPVRASLEQWERDWLGSPEATFVALADGQVVGVAVLQLDADEPERAENAITAVLRGWRGRGIGSVLKRTTLAWAAEHGIHELSSWAAQRNGAIRRLNERLGYVDRGVSIAVRRALPFEA